MINSRGTSTKSFGLLRAKTLELIGRLLTVRVRRKQVPQLLLAGGQFHAADPDAEPGAGSLSLLRNSAEEPRYGARNRAQRMTSLRSSQHGVRFT